MWFWMSVALAGPLADGFQGIPFGATRWPSRLAGARPPLEDCDTGESPVAWLCRHEIDGVHVVVTFDVVADLHTAFQIVALGDDCAALERSLQAVYGRGHKGAPDDRRWRDGFVIGSFNFDGESCAFRAENREVMREAQRATAPTGEGL